MKKRGTERKMLGKVVIATVEGDIHEIGKSLVATMLGASGFEVYDLGVDTPGDKIIGKALEVNADIIAMSALLTTTMVKQREVIEELEKEGLRKKVKIMVGGAPVTRDWVNAIGADGYLGRCDRRRDARQTIDGHEIRFTNRVREPVRSVTHSRFRSLVGRP